MKSTQLIDYFQRARKDPQLVVIEGVQALKHAARFRASFEYVISTNVAELTKMLGELAPDVTADILKQVVEVEVPVFEKLSPQPPRTQVIAVATRKLYDLKNIDQQKPIVLLEDPRDLENIGAAIRVSAAAGVAAVCITGPAEIWHPAVVRGGAGLHFALPVLNVSLQEITKLKRPLISLDPTGEEIASIKLPENAVLIFGTERHGISQKTLDLSDQIVRLRMSPGVSSLNLATSVAATLYSSVQLEP